MTATISSISSPSLSLLRVHLRACRDIGYSAWVDLRFLGLCIHRYSQWWEYDSDASRELLGRISRSLFFLQVPSGVMTHHNLWANIWSGRLLALFVTFSLLLWCIEGRRSRMTSRILWCFAWLYGLLQSFELSLPLHDVRIVPLDIPRESEPTSEFIGVDLRESIIKSRCILEFATSDIESIFCEVSTTPEYESHPTLFSTISDDRIAVEEPDRMSVPDFACCIREYSLYLRSESFADSSVSLGQSGFVAEDVRRSRHSVVFMLMFLYQ